ncbi:MAG TPA: FG-GAP-like repeat-containing protein [Planctomycetota bacterium]|nr:FG-GAP-like repeat-containing protein [Planctomycetota bacterium]
MRTLHALVAAAPFLVTAARAQAPIAFDAPVRHVLPSVPEPVALGDLDGDGILDIVLASTASRGGLDGDSVTVLGGKSDGSFTSKGDFPAGDRPEGVTLGKFDAGASLDVATANFGESTVSVLFGTGNGLLSSPVKTPVPGGPRFVVASDWNGDGLSDLATANFNGGTVSILMGSGDGSFLITGTIAVGRGPEVLALGHLTAGQDVDLAVVNSLDNTVTPLRGLGAGVFEAGTPHPVGLRPRFVLVEDLDKDGLGDLLVANDDSHMVTLERNLGGLTFVRAGQISFDRQGNFLAAPDYIALADMDGDGLTDILATWSLGDAFTISRAVVATPFEPALPLVFETGMTPVGIAAADFNQDGAGDVFVTNALADAAQVFLSLPANAGVIVDDGAVGTTPIGPWSPSQALFPHGTGSLFSMNGTRYRWEADLPAGTYDVLMWWTALPSRAASVAVEVSHGGGKWARLVDQRRGIGIWHTLGRFSLGGGKTEVTLAAPLGEASVSADAVRFKRITGDPAPPPAPTLRVSVLEKPADTFLGGASVFAFGASLEVVGGAGDAEWVAAVFAPAGTGVESERISAARLLIDGDGDGAPGPGDRQLGESLAFPSDIRVITFSGFSEPLTAGTTRGIFVVCDVVSDGGPRELQLELVSLVVRSSVDGAPARVEGLPAAGWTFPEELAAGRRVPGDGNQDGALNISDGIHLLNYLFASSVDPLPCGNGTLASRGNVTLLDFNGDSKANISDAVRLFNHLFLGGPPHVLGSGCVEIEGCPDSEGCGEDQG